MVRRSPKELDPFSRDLLFVSIFESCKHRKTALDDASALALTIIGELIKIVEDGSLERDTIVAVAAAVLERFDAAAATMYAAYHPLRA